MLLWCWSGACSEGIKVEGGRWKVGCEVGRGRVRKWRVRTLVDGNHLLPQLLVDGSRHVASRLASRGGMAGLAAGLSLVENASPVVRW